MHAIELSIVIPVYQSGPLLQSLFDRLTAVLDGLNKTYEIIFIDDGSRDNSWSILEGLQKAHPDKVVAIQLMRNFGQHNATMCGFRRSTGKYVVTMDDDLQHPPEEIPKLIDEIEKTGQDLVYGKYDQSKKHSALQNLGTRLLHASHHRVFKTDVNPTSFRIIRRQLLECIFPYSLNYTAIDGLLAWNTQSIGQIEVEHHERPEGRSGYSLGLQFVTALTLITNFSLWPLRFFSLLGAIAAISGFLLGSYYFFQALIANLVVPGYASTIVSIFVLGGLQLLALGMIGEYLGRVHMNISSKPQYFERQVLARKCKLETEDETTTPSEHSE